MKSVLIAALGLAMGLSAQEVRLTQIASGISGPTDIQNAGDGSGRLFFVQQSGVIRIFRNGALLPQPFLDISSRTHADGERGLLGLAFPPGFAKTGRFYVDYTDLNGDTTIGMYRVLDNPDVADPSEVTLLKITQPFANHNGGQVRFGPDGYLYIAMGDGGSGGDPFGNGQNRNVLLAKLLRIDVESEPGVVHIPPDNPFVNVAGARPEIWAYGLRNPWRFSFDRATNDLWIADVGQDSYEEIDFQPASSHGGENYGWNLMEGLHCFTPNCNTQGLTLPIVEYPHTLGCSVTGGFVYRGRSSPGMRGLYLYADYCSGRIWGIERQGSTWSNRQLLLSGFSVTTFGEDEAGELYLSNAATGSIYRVDGSRAPRANAGAVVNAASYASGLVAGSLSTVFAPGVLDTPGTVSASAVPLPNSLSGVTVMVNGTAAPINAIANRNGQEQVNFQAPFEIRGRSSVSVVVTRDGQASASIDVPVVDVQPATYTSDNVHAVAVHNATYELVSASNPLIRGEYSFVYAAGLGAVTNQPATGAASPASPLASVQGDVRVTIGGAPCEVQFAGFAPGFVGVYQVNFRVPSGVTSGEQDLVIAVGAVMGPAVKVFAQ
jgi:uncharacterized protein (TIGR03437 family)